jgi:1-acyl-sn-glycerol-3-phosphate acyltransferase
MIKPHNQIKTDFDRAKTILKPIFIPFNKYISYIGCENIVKDGPSLIIANHTGIGRDIAGILTVVDRQIYFLTSHYMFNKRELLQYIKTTLGRIIYYISYPFLFIFAKYLSEKLTQLEMIPINKSYSGDKIELTKNIRQSIEKVKEYLLKDRAVVIFQSRLDMLKTIGHQEITFKKQSGFHHYIPKFHPTVGKIVYELFQEHGLKVPVSPISIYGGEGLNPFKRMVLNVGEPITITSCIESSTIGNPINNFTQCLEKKIADLLIESGLQSISNS